jgi:glycosyltransferase involved in cell wall biosynthesis
VGSDPDAPGRRSAQCRRRAPRVLILVENLPLARDRRLGKQVRSLVAAGYGVTVICRRAQGNRRFEGVDVLEYPAPTDATSKLGFVREYGYSWLMTVALTLRAACRPRFDVLQICGPPDIYFAIGVLFRALGKPMVFDQRDPSPELYAARYGRAGGLVYQALRLLELLTYRSADHVVTVNHTLELIAHRRGRLAPQAVTVVVNGPLLADCRARPPRPELRRGRRYLCCWVGAMGPQDQLPLAVLAVHHLVRELGRTDCHFAFVGDGETQRDAEELARRLRIQDWVSFPGFLETDEVMAYLTTADLGMDPGLDETVTPVKTMEYMAVGLPFVAFDVTEVRAAAGGAALYAPPGDVSEFAGLIVALLDDADLRERLGQVGRRRVTEDLAWDHQQRAYLAVFDRLLHPSTGVPVHQLADTSADDVGRVPDQR